MKKLFLTTHCLFALTLLLLCSCADTKKLRYFQDLSQSNSPSDISIAKYTEPVIQPDDILSINVNTLDPEATNSINSRNGGFSTIGVNYGSGTVTPISGYLVDRQGFVDIPIIGKMKLAGLTTLEARSLVEKKAALTLKSPVVDIRFTNFKITVIGEVNRPASYVMPNEQVTLLDAIGYAGDLTIYGKRENILLIRKDASGRNVSIKMDMTRKDILNSPYFYLRQNDVIYVEPNKTKVLNNDNNVIKYISAGATIFTAIILGIRYL
ncbi:polysaccharide biosynthesis/export family protein [Mucilaginibacter sp.]|jgi:polysaccharide export outer membrane protein|uniref:polysaccharide biosynthesis/export family protein n=1 Tax=Mucilaginibacter sp. TaxID=1882438 RepID=UPI003562C6FA